ncbi:hypothetical protein CXG81DRAFT_23916 [Caulochytrium protostelioides]|uniref:Uncharacterized protein n=1 Tax=Caulochytrium protostelioides TaxID=1555241 RepID=A0A4P9XE06_9FUNG|nr:hypothetical protein CXG81DRAFT_23916 [Caulochytrium protostelioides]|eukprot:RKP03390.1 hypothetical protein CXG81DRAFT_23916 [Caulochytrium protostelioides]
MLPRIPHDLVDGRLLAVQIFYRELVQVRADALRWLLLLAELRQIQNTLGSVIGENDPYEKHYVHFAEPATQQTPETLKQFFIDASLAARPPFDFFAHLVDTAEDAGMISEAVHAEKSTHRFHFWDVLDTIFFNNPLFINELMASETASLKFYGALHAKLVEDQFMMKHQLRQQVPPVLSAGTLPLAPSSDSVLHDPRPGHRESSLARGDAGPGLGGSGPSVGDVPTRLQQQLQTIHVQQQQRRRGTSMTALRPASAAAPTAAPTAASARWRSPDRRVDHPAVGDDADATRTRSQNTTFLSVLDATDPEDDPSIESSHTDLSAKVARLWSRSRIHLPSPPQPVYPAFPPPAVPHPSPPRGTPAALRAPSAIAPPVAMSAPVLSEVSTVAAAAAPAASVAPAPPVPPEPGPAPPAVLLTLERTMARLESQSAQQTASLAQIERALERETAAHAATRRDARAKQALLRQRLDAAAHARDQAVAAAAEQAARTSQLKAALVAAEAAVAEARDDGAALHAAEAAAARAALGAKAASLAAMRDTLAAREAAVVRADAMVAEVRQDAASLREQNAALRSERDAAQAALRRAEASAAAAAKTAAAEMEAAAAAAQRDRKRLQRAVQAAEDRATRMKADADAALAKAAAAETAAAQLAAAQAKIRTLQAELARKRTLLQSRADRAVNAAPSAGLASAGVAIGSTAAEATAAAARPASVSSPAAAADAATCSDAAALQSRYHAISAHVALLHRLLLSSYTALLRQETAATGAMGTAAAPPSAGALATSPCPCPIERTPSAAAGRRRSGSGPGSPPARPRNAASGILGDLSGIALSEPEVASRAHPSYGGLSGMLETLDLDASGGGMSGGMSGDGPRRGQEDMPAATASRVLSGDGVPAPEVRDRRLGSAEADAVSGVDPTDVDDPRLLALSRAFLGVTDLHAFLAQTGRVGRALEAARAAQTARVRDLLARVADLVGVPPPPPGRRGKPRVHPVVAEIDQTLTLIFAQVLPELQTVRTPVHLIA